MQGSWGGASKEGIDSEQHHYMTVSGSFGPGSAHILPRHPNEGNWVTLPASVDIINFSLAAAAAVPPLCV